MEIILASASSRRQQLLRDAGFDFVVRTREIEETYPSSLPAEEVAPYLARKKAEATRSFLQSPRQVLLTADSTVILGDAIFGKPRDEADAARMLRALSGKVHRVITGVCLLSLERERVFSSVSEVEFAPLSMEEIHYYIERCRPYDKAGAYAIQEWIGLCKIPRISGSYANIVGLPVDRVYEELREF